MNIFTMSKFIKINSNIYFWKQFLNNITEMLVIDKNKE